MSQADALRRIEELETQNRRRELAPMLERLSAETGLPADDILAEAERLRSVYGGDIAAIELGIAWEQGVTIERIRAEASR
jgi:regulator of PEP synthase PpsR (kinase-PPPase family)